MANSLRDALFEEITDYYSGQLTERLDQVRNEHQARVEAITDKALAAITGEKPGKVKAKAPRKPRADKGRKRMGRGMPEVPAKYPGVTQEPGGPLGPSCASCDHYDIYHEDKAGPCTLPGCGCEAFVSESEVEPAAL